jgi:phosphoribosylaminoimidazolecarboxamide formyltransferase/IMP cyclohydrolase
MLQHLVEIYNQKKNIFAIYNNNYIMTQPNDSVSTNFSIFKRRSRADSKKTSQNVVLYSTGGTEDFIKT